MNIFKKKEKPVTTIHQCPAEGCEYTSAESANMKKHVEWKHPGFAQKDESGIKNSR